MPIISHASRVFLYINLSSPPPFHTAHRIFARRKHLLTLYKTEPGTLGGLSELGAALEEESNADMAMDNNDDDEVLEDEESVVEGPKLSGDLVFRPAPSR